MSMLTATLGDKGRVVVPAEVGRRQGWRKGTSLVFIESESGVRLVSADDALAQFRASVAGVPSPVDELVAERRAEAAAEARG
jgi:bifunctional DNA-binding transcriptional regulator/antitoxin component of YhaV-PrlF toxin-antitoxin module